MLIVNKRVYQIFGFLMLFSASNVLSESDVLSGADDHARIIGQNFQDACDCETRLQIFCLCANQIKTHCIDVDQKINAPNASIVASAIKAQNACIGELRVTGKSCLNSVSATDICAENIYAGSICTTEPVSFSQLEVCQQFRGTVVYSEDTTYNLGDELDFDLTLDDPNGDFTFSPTTYNVPVSGYYIATLQVDQHNLQGADAILGVPVARMRILVNGNVFRETFNPFLTFSNQQRSTFSSLMSLKAGDEVTSTYDVMVLTDTGIVMYNGTVDIEGNGIEENSSMFKIHYLSSDCANTPCQAPCTPCTSTTCDLQPSPCLPCFM